MSCFKLRRLKPFKLEFWILKHLNGFVKEHNNTPRFNRIYAHISFRIDPEWYILDFLSENIAISKKVSTNIVKFAANAKIFNNRLKSSRNFEQKIVKFATNAKN